jgi:hypothetical protein
MSTAVDAPVFDERARLKKRINELEESDRIRKKENATLRAQARQNSKQAIKLRKKVHRLEKLIARMISPKCKGKHQEMVQIVGKHNAEIYKMHQDEEKALANVCEESEEGKDKDKELAEGIEDMVLH